MKTKLKFFLFVIAIGTLSINYTPCNAQLSKIGKTLKNKTKGVKGISKKNVKKIENKAGANGYSEDCLKIKKNLDNRAQSAERFLNEGKLSIARARINDLKKFIAKYKDGHCPLVNKWETKYEELQKEYDNKVISDDPIYALVKAVKDGDKQKIDKAMSLGADINGVQNQNCALFTAINEGNIDMVKYLVVKGANVNVDNKFETALERCVKKEQTEIFKFLLSKGADVNKCYKNLVLMVASKKNLAMMKELAEGQNIDITKDEKDNKKIIYSRKSTALAYVDENSETGKYIKERIIRANKAKVTDATNKKFANRMVFSTEKIPAKNGNSSKFGSKFQAVKDFHGRIYFPCLYSDFYYGTKSNSPNPYKESMSVWAKIDGDSKKFNIFNGKIGGENDASTYGFVINTREYRETYHKFFMRLNQGDTKVTFWVTADSDSLFTETITLTKKAGDYYRVGKTFADYKAGMKNGAYEAGILKSIKSYASNAGWKEKFSAVKIVSTDWHIVRHDISGRILYRTLSAYCLAKWPDGYCTVQRFTFKQDYNGSSYSSVFKKYSVGSQNVVDCR